MKERGIFFGTSIMMTRENADEVTSYPFVHELAESGCKLFFFVEYVPVGKGDTDWVLTESQRKRRL
jgi:MoaA/NifB/PqqE/SkfB family radical SAM enzyme